MKSNNVVKFYVCKASQFPHSRSLMYVPTYVIIYNVCIAPFVVRLVNGSTQYDGRVEVYYNGEWGTVCDDGWDLTDAQVVCRQLGFVTAIASRDNAYYGQGSGQIWLGDVACLGTELNIENCSHGGWGIEDCSHGEDVGVRCGVSDGKYWLLSSLCIKYVNIFNFYIISTVL